MIAELFNEIIAGKRLALSKGITIIESALESDELLAAELIELALNHKKQLPPAKRIGITGLPGAGKSTLINTLGFNLCNQGHKVAVLAHDPSSLISGGSILGDKTRMTELAAHKLSFIRPSPNKTSLGGVGQNTHEVILLLEAAGYSCIFIETVGVGQSEVEVRNLTDMLILTFVTGLGDELQLFKRGILEHIDLTVFTKAEGDNLKKAKLEISRFNRSRQESKSFTPGWKVKALSCSVNDNESINNLIQNINDFFDYLLDSDLLFKQRIESSKSRLKGCVINQLINLTFKNKEATDLINQEIFKLDLDNLYPEKLAKKITTQLLNKINLITL